MKKGLSKVQGAADIESLKDSELREIIEKLGKGNRIGYYEFLLLALDLTELINLREDFMTVLFRYFDVDSNEVISHQDIAQALRSNGKEMDAQDVKRLINSSSSHGLGGLSFHSFRSLLLLTQEKQGDGMMVTNEDQADCESNVLVEIVSDIHIILFE